MNCTMETTTTSLPPTVLVIFGGGGDLTWRKLTPALFDLCLDHSMPEKFAIIAADRAELASATKQLPFFSEV
jgi:glucose-6-phosphate 1-dehydrogenase